ncbi:Non-specific serine/threonine protein kinase [Forsythia ovata]|uniref:Non-specific serine/threonine protein kinase n=1 Tax=Forsythia ovata TaxID=205694 RepID=A0ABD1XAN5_9LAMI
MATDSNKLKHRKHRRSSSPDDSKDLKRRKHRHRHHHRSKREKKEIKKTDPGKGEDVVRNGAMGEVVVSNGWGFVGVDYDMEEGEIVDDDVNNGDGNNGEFERKKKKFDSDVESGEFETVGHDSTYMGINEDNVERVYRNSSMFREDNLDWEENSEMGRERKSSLKDFANGNYKLQISQRQPEAS